MKPGRACSSCGAVLPSDAPETLCAACRALLAASTVRDQAEATTEIMTERIITGPLAERIGHYKLLQKIGEGGFGVVYMADQEQPVKRRVALKVIKLGMDTRQVVARFEAERQALALMDHPNIAKVLDGGATEAGRPYFVMELVKGIKITQYCDQNHVGLKERLDLFLQVCQAIQHAHQKGIIHRDIKPSNIMVTMHDGAPVPKVIDFGIAKATEQRLTDKTLFTQYEQFMGTPAYMSPEQAEMSGLNIDTRSDIYSLGVLLYELLTGRTPFENEALLQRGVEEARRTIREVEPPRPSTTLTDLVAADVRRLTNSTDEKDRASLRRLLQEKKEKINFIRGDLDWIVMKCLEKDRTRRYETTNGLAMDIKRYLNQEPVIARPPTTIYRFQKLVRRNKAAVAAAVMIFIALVGGLGTATWSLIGERRARFDAEQAGIRERRERQHAWSQTKRAEQTAASLRLNLYVSDMNVTHHDVIENNFGRAVRVLRQYIPGRGEDDLRGFEWRYLWQQCQGDELLTLEGAQRGRACAVVSPDGGLLAMASGGSTVKIWDFTARRILTNLTGFRGLVRQIGFSAAGTTAAIADQSRVTLWNTTDWRLRGEITGLYPTLRPIAFAPGEDLLAVRRRSGIIFWDVKFGAEKKERFDLPAGTMHEALTFSHDGRNLGLCNEREILIWDMRTGAMMARLASPFFQPIAITFSQSGDEVLAADWNGTVKIWSLRTGEELPSRIADANSNFIFAMACSPDGKTLALGGSGQLIDLWNLADQTKIGSLKGHQHEIWTLAFTPDGESLVSASLDGTVKLWRAQLRRESNVLRRSALEIGLTSGGKSLLVAASGVIEHWDTRTRKLSETIDIALAGTNVLSRAFSDAGEYAAFGRSDGTMRILHLPTKTWRQTITNRSGTAHGIEFCPRSSILAAACSRTNMTGKWQYTIELWRLDPVQALTFYTDALADNWDNLTFSADGEYLAVIGTDNSVKIAELRGQTLRAELPVQKRGINAMAFSPNKSLLAIVAASEVNIWNLQSRQIMSVLRGHRQDVTCVTFLPDGKTLASTGESGAIKLWNVATGKELFTLRGFEESQHAVVFSADGAVLAALGRPTGRGSVSLFHVPPLAEIDAILNHARVAFAEQ